MNIAQFALWDVPLCVVSMTNRRYWHEELCRYDTYSIIYVHLCRPNFSKSEMEWLELYPEWVELTRSFPWGGILYPVGGIKYYTHFSWIISNPWLIIICYVEHVGPLHYVTEVVEFMGKIGYI